MSFFGKEKDPLEGLRGPQPQNQAASSQETEKDDEPTYDVTFNYDNGYSVDMSLIKEDLLRLDEWLNNPVAPNFLKIESEDGISYIRKEGLYNGNCE